MNWKPAPTTARTVEAEGGKCSSMMRMSGERAPGMPGGGEMQDIEDGLGLMDGGGEGKRNELEETLRND